MQFAPVVSASGFSSAGIESAHCHHSLLNCLYAAVSASATFTGIEIPAATATSAASIDRILLIASP